MKSFSIILLSSSYLRRPGSSSAIIFYILLGHLALASLFAQKNYFHRVYIILEYPLEIRENIRIPIVGGGGGQATAYMMTLLLLSLPFFIRLKNIFLFVWIGLQLCFFCAH